RDVFWRRLFNRPGVWTGGFLKRLLNRFGFDNTIPPSVRLARFANELGSRLEPWSFSNKERPVLIIDEANALKRMEKHSNVLTVFNFKIVNVLLDFALTVTQSNSKMHIIFTTSDSLFLDWITQQTKEILSSMDFGIVYKMTGGRMFFIVDYINQAPARFTTRIHILYRTREKAWPWRGQRNAGKKSDPVLTKFTFFQGPHTSSIRICCHSTKSTSSLCHENACKGDGAGVVLPMKKMIKKIQARYRHFYSIILGKNRVHGSFPNRIILGDRCGYSQKT
ncbi:hypothetical protein MJO28_001207, partial [Puccinia striiformis f. sp. tritici]